MDFKIPQEAIDSIAKHINDRNNKSYNIPIVGHQNNIETPQIFEITPFNKIDNTDIKAFAIDGSKNSHTFYNGISIGIYRSGYVCFEHGKQIRLNNLDDPVILGNAYSPNNILVTCEEHLSAIYDELIALPPVKAFLGFLDGPLDDIFPYNRDVVCRTLSTLLDFCQEILEWSLIYEIVNSNRINSGDFILRDGTLRSLNIKQKYLVKLGKLLAQDKKVYLIGITKNSPIKMESRWYRCVGPQKSFIQCNNKAIKADEIEPKVSVLLSTLLRSDRLKPSRWKTVTDAIRQDCPPIDEKERLRLQNKLKKVQAKQSKLTDFYLENVLGEDVYHDKITALRKDEEELKKQLALQSLREIERERSEDYMHRVEDFLAGYQPNKKSLNCYEQKQVMGLLFKNIKIARKDIFSFEFFAPFNSLFLEQEKNEKCLKNQRLMKNLRPESISAPLAAK